MGVWAYGRWALGVWAYARVGFRSRLDRSPPSRFVHSQARSHADTPTRRHVPTSPRPHVPTSPRPHVPTPLRPYVSPIDSLHGVTKVMAYV
jgi:hypothetical protein